MSKKSLINFLLVMVSFAGYAQNDWREGYIIENHGDTIHGLIDYRSPKSNSQNTYFRKNEQDKTKKFSPEEIEGYRYKNGKYYISKNISIDEEESPVFLEFLFEGAANLYYLKDDSERYFIEVDNRIHELKNTERTVYKNGTEYSKEQKEYIGALNHLFQEADLKDDIARTELRHPSLIRIVRKYHNKVNTDEESLVFEKKIKPISVDFGVLYGMNNKSLHLRRSLTYTLEDGPGNFFGLTFNIGNIPGVYERFSLQLELLASEYYLENDKKYQVNVPLLVNYKITSTKLYPQVELGTSMYFIRNDLAKGEHMGFLAGLSVHYEFYKSTRVFLSTRIESKPKILRFGVGLVF